MKLDQGAGALVAGFAGFQRRLADFTRLVEEFSDLFLIAEQKLANGSARLFVLRRVAPQHMFEEEKMLLVNFFFAFEVGIPL